MADFSSLNGYNVKDTNSRQRLNTLETTVNTSHEGRLNTLETTVNTSHEGRLNTLELNEIENLRKENYNKYTEFVSPFTLHTFLKNVLKIFKSNDNKNYKYYINESYFRRTGGTTYYIDGVNGDDENNGTTEQTAWKSIKKIINNTVEGDTVYIKSGIYYRNLAADMFNPLDHSLNIIGDGNVIITRGDSYTYTQNGTYSNVYQTKRSNVNNVIGFYNNLFIKYELKSTLEEVSNNINSWYQDGTNVYINNGGVVNNDNTIVLLNDSSHGFYIKPEDNSNDIYVYMENITILGGNYSSLMISVATQGTNTANVLCKNCNFFYGGNVGQNYNVVDVNSANGVFINCNASFGHKDGINYKYSRTSVYSNGIEIDCIGANNGNTDNSNNGSTAHGGTQVIRINGNYFNNKGVNIGDIHEDTKSLNFNVNAFDSLSSEDTGSIDFGALSPEAEMYLYNCNSKGSNSIYNLAGTGSAQIYQNGCKYDTTYGNVNNI